MFEIALEPPRLARIGSEHNLDAGVGQRLQVPRRRIESDLVLLGRFARADARLRPEIQNWGARVTWMNADEDLRVSLWGKNLNEDWDITNFGPPSPCCASFAVGFRGKQEIGLTATKDF